ncbi:MAG: 6-phosphofructokinase [Anaerolineae bacterium]|nr:6-phosphofructokinase [Anaerolineae bacterium]
MTSRYVNNLGVLTSGGDAPGMNAAVRSVVRTALDRGVKVYAIYEGYQGMVDGGKHIREMEWGAVSNIMNLGGTVIGSARCADFRTHEGRLRAAKNLIDHGIDGLAVIGGDGSLTGANLFREEWPDLINELVDTGQVTKNQAKQHSQLAIVGMVGSIDNDMFGTDMTIGADTALHRITDAIDAISSTAASHQRSFIVEVMGRNCGYLALMSALATGADWALIPESPPDVDDWEAKMCEVLIAGRKAGRRDSIIIVAEGAQDRYGNPITCDYVQKVLEDRLGEDARVTILGHVQRGGSPSAFDRYLTTLLGYAAVEQILQATPETEPQLIGMRENRITHSSLMDSVRQTHAVADFIAAKDYDKAMEMRGGSFRENFRTLRTLVRALPHPSDPKQKVLRLAVIHGGGPAPGMNTAARTAIRLGLDKGHTMLGIDNGITGLINGHIREMDWMSVHGWASKGGAELGTNRHVPKKSEFYAIARQLEEHRVDGLLMIGGWSGYQSLYKMYNERESFPAFNIPMICLPATINNNLPGSELSIGSDTALNSIVEVVDKIKQSAVASHRCFVVEVMGRNCGYLALMSGLATGAERAYLAEEGVSIADLQKDLSDLIEGFRRGKRLGLLIRNERSNPLYTTSFMAALFEEEGGDLFDVRTAILGHMQQGGDPTPFDRIQAIRLSRRCIEFLIEESEKDRPSSAFMGIRGGKVQFFNMDNLPHMMDADVERPKEQWWMELRPIARVMSQPAPQRR